MRVRPIASAEKKNESNPWEARIILREQDIGREWRGGSERRGGTEHEWDRLPLDVVCEFGNVCQVLGISLDLILAEFLLFLDEIVDHHGEVMEKSELILEVLDGSVRLCQFFDQFLFALEGAFQLFFPLALGAHFILERFLRRIELPL